MSNHVGALPNQTRPQTQLRPGEIFKLLPSNITTSTAFYTWCKNLNLMPRDWINYLDFLKTKAATHDEILYIDLFKEKFERIICSPESVARGIINVDKNGE